VKSLFTPDKEDPDYVYSYPLQWSVADDIMGIIGRREGPWLRYYIESFAHA
jgi:hypothetical protein